MCTFVITVPEEITKQALNGSVFVRTQNIFKVRSLTVTLGKQEISGLETVVLF